MIKIYGLLASFLFLACFQSNAAPNISIKSISISKNPLLVNETSVFTAEIKNPNNYVITYTWTISGGTKTSQNENILNWQAPATAGTYTITLKIAAKTEKAESSVDVVVNNAICTTNSLTKNFDNEIYVTTNESSHVFESRMIVSNCLLRPTTSSIAILDNAGVPTGLPAACMGTGADTTNLLIQCPVNFSIGYPAGRYQIELMIKQDSGTNAFYQIINFNVAGTIPF